jgi:hypothetical protein
MRRRLPAASAVVIPVALAACATIMHGPKQDIGISSTPTAARVVVNNQPRGTTPVVLELARKENHIVRIELDGYQPFEATLTKKVSGWVWGNIVFGGIIGLAVDAMTGGLYNLTPEQIAATMVQRTGSTGKVTKDGLYVVLVEKADPAWERIGTLRVQ